MSERGRGEKKAGHHHRMAFFEKATSRLLKKSDFVRSSTLDARTVLNPNGNKQESKRLFDAPKNIFQQPARLVNHRFEPLLH
jgi:hypothetical protein